MLSKNIKSVFSLIDEVNSVDVPSLPRFYSDIIFKEEYLSPVISVENNVKISVYAYWKDKLTDEYDGYIYLIDTHTHSIKNIKFNNISDKNHVIMAVLEKNGCVKDIIPTGMYSILEQIYNVEPGVLPFHSTISKISVGPGFSRYWYLNLQITKNVEPPIILIDYEKINQPLCVVPFERQLRKLPASKQDKWILDYLSNPYWIYTYLRPNTIATLQLSENIIYDQLEQTLNICGIDMYAAYIIIQHEGIKLNDNVLFKMGPHISYTYNISELELKEDNWFVLPLTPSIKCYTDYSLRIPNKYAKIPCSLTFHNLSTLQKNNLTITILQHCCEDSIHCIERVTVRAYTKVMKNVF